MKLKVKLLDNGNRTDILLCDEQGQPLPMQRATTLDCSYDDLPLLTVTFIVDGRDIELVPSK